MDFNSFHDLILSLSDYSARFGEAESLRLLEDALQQLTEKRSLLSQEDDQRDMKEFRRLLHSAFLQSEFGDYVFRRPRGYPGDFVTQEMIWFGRTLGGEHRYRGNTPLGKLLSALTFEMPACKAGEERIRWLQQRVRTGGKRLASIGCGSGIELWNQKDIDVCDVLLVDQDEGALERAKSQINGCIARTTFVRQNVLKFILRDSADESVSRRDLVYSAGLFDYFDQPSAARLTQALWQMVAAGGCLVVTNAHPANPTRFWMEYVGDWFLKYKDETQMRSLADDLKGVASVTLTLDSQGVHQYLEIRKEA